MSCGISLRDDKGNFIHECMLEARRCKTRKVNKKTEHAWKKYSSKARKNLERNVIVLWSEKQQHRNPYQGSYKGMKNYILKQSKQPNTSLQPKEIRKGNISTNIMSQSNIKINVQVSKKKNMPRREAHVRLELFLGIRRQVFERWL